MSDPDRIVAQHYGTLRGADEKFPDFAKRFTFLIDPSGMVRKVYEVADIPAHPDAVLEDIRKMSAA